MIPIIALANEAGTTFGSGANCFLTSGRDKFHPFSYPNNILCIPARNLKRY